MGGGGVGGGRDRQTVRQTDTEKTKEAETEIERLKEVRSKQNKVRNTE